MTQYLVDYNMYDAMNTHITDKKEGSSHQHLLFLSCSSVAKIRRKKAKNKLILNQIIFKHCSTGQTCVEIGF